MSERYKRANKLPPGGASLEVASHSFSLRVDGDLGEEISKEVVGCIFQ